MVYQLHIQHLHTSLLAQCFAVLCGANPLGTYQQRVNLENTRVLKKLSDQQVEDLKDSLVFDLCHLISVDPDSKHNADIDDIFNAINEVIPT